MDQKFKNAAKNTARLTGRLAGKGSLGILNWFSKHIISGILIPGTIVFVGIFTVYWIWERRPLKVEKPPMTQVQIDQVQLDCYRNIGAEDGQNKEERMFAMIAADNLAKEMKISPCDVAAKFWTLRAPNHPVLKISHRPMKITETLRGFSDSAKAEFDQLLIDFPNHLSNPNPLREKYPWLACVTRYKRTTFTGLYPWPDNQLDETMKLVHTTASGAKYYCAK